MNKPISTRLWADTVKIERELKLKVFVLEKDKAALIKLYGISTELVKQLESLLYDEYGSKYSYDYRDEMEDTLEHVALPDIEHRWLTKHIKTVEEDQ